MHFGRLSLSQAICQQIRAHNKSDMRTRRTLLFQLNDFLRLIAYLVGYRKLKGTRHPMFIQPWKVHSFWENVTNPRDIKNFCCSKRQTVFSQNVSKYVLSTMGVSKESISKFLECKQSQPGLLEKRNKW